MAAPPEKVKPQPEVAPVVAPVKSKKKSTAKKKAVAKAPVEVSKEGKEQARVPVKSDIFIWQPGKQIQEMFDFQVKLIENIQEIVLDLSSNRKQINTGMIHTVLKELDFVKEAGVEIKHESIKKLLAKHFNIHNSRAGRHTYESAKIQALYPSTAE
ncbi:hypothetical protein LCGC14_0267120 [marine sediment metagenome]|uniref:Uncharacterized protein n=1 Tax=marine sediment metagenome TaxID=412755 RepID=A0A0F9WKJ7_9ZZZZ